MVKNDQTRNAASATSARATACDSVHRSRDERQKDKEISLIIRSKFLKSIEGCTLWR